MEEFENMSDNNGHRRLSCGLVLGRHLVRVAAEKVELAEGEQYEEQTTERI